MSDAMEYDDEPTQRTLLELTPRPDDVRTAIAHLRWGAQRDRRERRALRRWAMGVIVSVVLSSLAVAIAIGRYAERVDAAQRSIERVEQLLLAGER